jgi:subtilisin family serine protease
MALHAILAGKNSSHVFFRVGTEHGNSSLEAGTYSTTLSYYYGTAPAGGGGSGSMNQGGTGERPSFRYAVSDRGTERDLYPAKYSTVMAVSSTTETDALSGFSSTGPEVEVAASGSSIYSTVIRGYDTFSGTSMACPHVSGAGGQLMDNGDTNTQARDRIGSTAENIGPSPNEFGNGLLDVAAALGLDSSDDLSG